MFCQRTRHEILHKDASWQISLRSAAWNPRALHAAEDREAEREFKRLDKQQQKVEASERRAALEDRKDRAREDRDKEKGRRRSCCSREHGKGLQRNKRQEHSM